VVWIRCFFFMDELKTFIFFYINKNVRLRAVNVILIHKYSRIKYINNSEQYIRLIRSTDASVQSIGNNIRNTSFFFFYSACLPTTRWREFAANELYHHMSPMVSHRSSRFGRGSLSFPTIRRRFLYYNILIRVLRHTSSSLAVTIEPKRNG